MGDVGTSSGAMAGFCANCCGRLQRSRRSTNFKSSSIAPGLTIFISSIRSARLCESWRHCESSGSEQPPVDSRSASYDPGRPRREDRCAVLPECLFLVPGLWAYAGATGNSRHDRRQKSSVFICVAPAGKSLALEGPARLEAGDDDPDRIPVFEDGDHGPAPCCRGSDPRGLRRQRGSLPENGCPAGRSPFALYVGGISPNKNIEGILRAFADSRIRKERPLRLVLVGDFQEDSFLSDYQRLKTIAADLGVAHEVDFAGFVPDDKLAEMYNQAAVFVMPSFDEGFGLPAVEAMACGAPVIVSSGNALEETTAGAGICVDPHDVGGLTEAIDTVLSDAEIASAMRDRSLKRAAEFSWDKCARSVVGLLEEIAR